MKNKRIPIYAFLCLFAFLTGLSLQNVIHANPMTLLDVFCLLFSGVMTTELLIILHLVDSEGEPSVEVIGVE